MDSRERMLKALRHEQLDRVPIHDSLWLEIVRQWQTQGLPTEVTIITKSQMKTTRLFVATA